MFTLNSHLNAHQAGFAAIRIQCELMLCSHRTLCLLDAYTSHDTCLTTWSCVHVVGVDGAIFGVSRVLLKLGKYALIQSDTDLCTIVNEALVVLVLSLVVCVDEGESTCHFLVLHIRWYSVYCINHYCHCTVGGGGLVGWSSENFLRPEVWITVQWKQ